MLLKVLLRDCSNQLLAKSDKQLPQLERIRLAVAVQHVLMKLLPSVTVVLVTEDLHHQLEHLLPHVWI